MPPNSDKRGLIYIYIITYNKVWGSIGPTRPGACLPSPDLVSYGILFTRGLPAHRIDITPGCLNTEPEIRNE